MFSCNEMGIFRKDLNKINLDDSNQNDDSENNIYVALLELMFVAQHPKRRWNFCQKMKKRNRTNFYCVMILMSNGSIETFVTETLDVIQKSL